MAGAELEEEQPQGLSAFELERLENIKQNRLVLESLGIAIGGSRGSRSSRVGKQSKSGANKRQKVSKEDMAVFQQEVRRSARNVGKQLDYKEPTVPLESKAGSGASNKEEAELGDRDWRPANPRPPTAPAPGSSRGLNVDMSSIQPLLGKMIDHTGKQAVVDLLCPHARAKFSKYAGVLEWNNAIVLWVNADNNQYQNRFLGDGEEMTWYAGDRCVPYTPMFERLREYGGLSPRIPPADDEEEVTETQESQMKYGEPKGDVLLFCRKPGEPYVYLGRLEIVDCDVRKLPIKFVWRLKDHGVLKDLPDFAELLKAMSDKQKS